MVTIVWYLPVVRYEIIYLMFVIISSTLILFGYSVSTVGEILSEIDRKTRKNKDEVQTINRFLKKHQIEPDVILKIFKTDKKKKKKKKNQKFLRKNTKYNYF
jgi:DNA-binding protein H-NS